MKTSIFINFFVLSIVYLIVQAQNQQCTCGGLGQGTNPCTCSDVVVKAAKLPKPTCYVSPQQIKDTATAKNSMIISVNTSQTGCSNPQSNSNVIVYNNSNSSPCSSSSSSSNSNSNTCGCSGSKQNSNSNTCGCSGSKQNSNSNTCGCSGSKQNSNSNTCGCNGSNQNSNSNTYGCSGSNQNSNSNTCGCNGSKQNTYSNSNSNVQTESSSIVYAGSSSYGSSGQIMIYTGDNSNEAKSDCGCKKQNIETLDDEDSTNSNSNNVVPRFSPVGDLCYPLPVQPNSGKIVEKTRVTPAYPGKLVCCPPSVPYEICINTATGETRRKIITTSSSDATSPYDSIIYATSNSGTSNTPIYKVVTTTVGNGGTTSTSYSSYGTVTGSNSKMYNLPLVYANLNARNGQQKQYSQMTMSSSSSDCFDDATEKTQEDMSYPAMPADAVSLTLAYKNLRAPNVIYRQGKQFVPEDKLSFGHRTVPANVKNENQVLDIPEEKLITVNKPVVELKLAPPKTVVIGSYDEQEEAKLAELEAIERESIIQEETSDQIAESLITYKDLGYAPVDASYTKSTSYNGKIDSSEEEPCGSLGPPIPGYVPGTVIVQESSIDNSYSNSGIPESNESIEIQTSGSGSCS